MYHNILTQKDYPDYSQIKKTIKLILEFIDTDAIYFSQHLEQKVNIGIITVIVSVNNLDSWDDIYDHSWKIFKSRPEFSFRVYNADWVMTEVNQGNTFFIMHCSEQELVYSDDDSTNVVILKNCNSKEFIQAANQTFYFDLNSNGIIGRDKNFYLDGENYLIAAYIMHQQLRSLFVSASWFLTGDWMSFQSLEKLQKKLSKFSSTLGSAFDPNKEEEWFVLEKLENANDAIQRNAEIEPISKETLEAASAKVDWLEKKVRKLFRQSIARSKEKLDMYNGKV